MKTSAELAAFLALVLYALAAMPVGEACCHGTGCNMFGCNCQSCGQRYPMDEKGTCGWAGCPSGCGFWPGCKRGAPLPANVKPETFTVVSAQDEAGKTFAYIDLDLDGKINADEAIAHLTREANMTEADVRSKFGELDKNKDGSIVPAEFDQLLVPSNTTIAIAVPKHRFLPTMKRSGAGAGAGNATGGGMPCEDKCVLTCTAVLTKYNSENTGCGATDTKVAEFCKKQCAETCGKKQNRILPLIGLGWALYEIFKDVTPSPTYYGGTWSTCPGCG